MSVCTLPLVATIAVIVMGLCALWRKDAALVTINKMVAWGAILWGLGAVASCFGGGQPARLFSDARAGDPLFIGLWGLLNLYLVVSSNDEKRSQRYKDIGQGALIASLMFVTLLGITMMRWSGFEMFLACLAVGLAFCAYVVLVGTDRRIYSLLGISIVFVNMIVCVGREYVAEKARFEAYRSQLVQADNRRFEGSPWTKEARKFEREREQREREVANELKAREGAVGALKGSLYALALGLFLTVGWYVTANEDPSGLSPEEQESESRRARDDEQSEARRQAEKENAEAAQRSRDAADAARVDQDLSSGP